VETVRKCGFIAALGFLGASCTGEPVAPSLRATPVFEQTTVRENANNVLSASVAVKVHDADSVAVRFRVAGTAVADDRVTPAVRTFGDSAVVPVLGLRAEQRYALSAVAYGPGESVIGHTVEFTTGALPSDLPQYRASGVDPSPGYIVFAAGKFGLVIDNTGLVVWYRRFPDGVGLSFMAEPNGRYVARPTTPDPTDLEPWLEFDQLGNNTRSLLCALGLQSRPHDLISDKDGGYWLMCDETRTMDLSAHSGNSSARVTGTNVQHLSAAGALLFQWSPFDHFAITDLAASERMGASVNWTHGNAIDIDADGNLIVSFRNLGEITKIDVKTGTVIWRMGGLKNQFAFDSPGVPFAGQHGARMSSPGHLILLDNVSNSVESRSKSYTVDEPTRTARLAISYGSVPGVVTQIGGSVQSLPGDRTLVSFGTTGRVEEYDASGRMTWHIEGNAGYVFRAQRISSLYAPGVGTSR
jgi:hypothetical protein